MTAEEVAEKAMKTWREIELSICFKWATMSPGSVAPKNIFESCEKECLEIIRKAIRKELKTEAKNDD